MGGAQRGSLAVRFAVAAFMNIQGDWQATKEHCGCGYTGVWTVTVSDDSTVVASENCGSHCCGCVPNCVPKRGPFAHRLTKESNNVWSGRMGCKPIRLTLEDDGTLRHLTTDGPMIMTRL